MIISPIIVASIIGVEASWLYYKYMIGDPTARSRVINEALAYITAYIAVVALFLLYKYSSTITNALASLFNIQVVSISNVGSVLASDWSTIYETWLLYWLVITILKLVSSFSFGIVTISPSALAGWIQNYGWAYSTGLEWLMADLVFLRAMWIYYNFLLETGLWIISLSLIIPKTTRALGSALASSFIILTITLPLLAGFLNHQVSISTGIISVNINFGSNPLASAVSKAISFDLSALETIVNDIKKSFQLPDIGYKLMVGDALLDIAYALVFYTMAWISRLIDENAPRLLNPP